MPSSRRQHQQPVQPGPAYNADTYLPLSNQDVEVLYTIVTTAQRLHHSSTTPLPPYRALFTAYDHVLADRRIDPNQDRVYFRFLLRMRGVDTSTIAASDIDDGTRTLYGRFEMLLAEMGIQLEVDEGGAAGVVVEEEAIEEDDDGDYGERQDFPAAGTPSLPQLSRRASFDDTTFHRSRRWDDDADDEEEEDAVPRSRRSRSRASDVLPPSRLRRPSSRASDTAAFPRRRRASDRNDAAAFVAPSAMHSGFPDRGRRLSSKNLLHAAEHARRSSRQAHGSRARSQSSQGSLKITRTEEIQRPVREPGFYDVDDFSTVPSRRSSISGPAPDENHFVPPEMLYRPSPTQMLADADTFLHARTLFAARKALRMWRDQAMALREREAQMEEAADLFNKKKRADAAFESLSVTVKARRAERETERFYEHNYQRVAKAFDQCKMWTALNHWHTNTVNAIRLTNRARAHVLLQKMFKAWYEQTAIEHEKIRRFRLKKFFRKWQRRYDTIKENEEVAETAHATNVIQDTLLACFWEFTERKASRWYEDKLLVRVWAILVDKIAFITERQAAVGLMVERDMKSKLFHLIANKMLNLQTLEPAAQNFREQKLLAQAFGNVKKQAQLRPLERQLTQRVVQSRAHEIFTVWHVRADQSVMATRLDRRRILGNAFTTWNENLRCFALRARIDGRVVLESLRKWMLEARASLFIRVRDARTKERVFRGWTGMVQDQNARLGRAERTCIILQDTRLKRKALGHLRYVLEGRKQREAEALALYEPFLLKKTWPKLLERHQHLQQLEQWGSDAQFYTVTTHALRRWKDSTHQAQKIRRREAYATIRRRTKLSMARRAFEKWRGKALAIEFMERQAQELQENAILGTAMRQLDHWHDKMLSVTQMAATADGFRGRELATRALGVWGSKLQDISRDEEKASTFMRVHVEVEASACLKKLNWRLFQIQQQKQSGVALEGRNFEKHVREMLRHWSEHMQRRRDLGVQAAPVFEDREDQAVAVDQRSEDLLDLTGEREVDNEAGIARNKHWTPFDSALDVGDLKLKLNFDPNVLDRPVLQPRPPGRSFSPEKPNPLAMTIRNPTDAAAAFASTPLPAYLRSPSKRSTVKARLAALSNNENNRPPHPLSQTATAAAPAGGDVLPSFTTSSAATPAAYSSTAAGGSGRGGAPSYSNSTFALNTHTGSTTPMAAPAGFGTFGGTFGGGGRAAPGTAPPAMRKTTTTTTTNNGNNNDDDDDNDVEPTAFAAVPNTTNNAGGTTTTTTKHNFGASTMLAATPGPPPQAAPASTSRLGAITPFSRKLTAQGYHANTPATTTTTTGRGRGRSSSSSARGGGGVMGTYGGVGLGLGLAASSGLGGFGGFEDIREDRESSPLVVQADDRRSSRESSP
ncbi:hypothetical protein SLS55_009947 [Diplodia seriata]|uniref:Sfi1 spindle body domain-containing protein n=1 Tax=Diplodia seriata TaxID=420778 RepID=A0ABR3C1F5_9PEZI